ncbi:MAG: hypothetical protein MHM6MM_009030 [Cercozoa sp. M6MM]
MTSEHSEEHKGPPEAVSVKVTRRRRSASARSKSELTGDPTSDLTRMSGFLCKRGERLGRMQRRFLVLRGHFLYSFRRKTDLSPSRVYFIDGCFVERVGRRGSPEERSLPFRITFPFLSAEMTETAEVEQHEKEQKAAAQALQHAQQRQQERSKIFWADSESEREQWIAALRMAARTAPLQQFYTIGSELGKGHFSSVHEATHKATGRRYAVKIIAKHRINAQEHAALKTEIAIMQLLRHPSICRFYESFETRDKIYIIMRILKGGDLFDKLQSMADKCLDEDTARIVVWKLLDVVHYLHSRGVVHRDLKPENVLLSDASDVTSIALSDFGLSKFATPFDLMSLPCGTLTYVAPEVLTLKGYGSKVDLWSIGCIAYLLLSGRLPFDGRSKSQVIDRTLHADLNWEAPHWEHKHVSEQAKSLIALLLQKDPEQRASFRQALAHEWFDPVRQQLRLDAQKHDAELIEHSAVAMLSPRGASCQSSREEYSLEDSNSSDSSDGPNVRQMSTIP